jgi:flagellin
MPQTINTNISSLTAQRNASRTADGALDGDRPRLVRPAHQTARKDDAAGLAISDG